MGANSNVPIVTQVNDLMVSIPLRSVLISIRVVTYAARTHTPILPTRMHEFLDDWCKFFYLIMGILSYCTFHHVYVQIALTEVLSRS